MQTLFLKYAFIIPETVRNTLGSFDEEREMILLKAFEVTETGHRVPSVIYNSSTQDGCRTFGFFFFNQESQHLKGAMTTGLLFS